MRSVFHIVSVLSRFIKSLFILLEYMLPSAIGIMILYIIFWQTGQGHDIIIEMSHPYMNFPVVLYFTAIIGLAIVIWYLPKEMFSRKFKYAFFPNSSFFPNAKYDDEKRKWLVNSEDERIVKTVARGSLYLPRLMAVISVLIGGNIFIYVFLAQMGVDQKIFAHLVLLGEILLCFYFAKPYTILINELFVNMPFKVLMLHMGLFIIGFITAYYTENVEHSAILYPMSLVISNLSVALALWSFLIVRTKIKFKKNHVFQKYLNAPKLISAFLIIVLAVFFYAWIMPIKLLYFNGLSAAVLVLLICMIVLVFTFIYLGIGKSYISFILLSVLIFSMSKINFQHNPFMVGLHGEIQQYRPSLHEYSESWMANHLVKKDTIQGEMPYPIYLVCSEGGGIRSSYWTMAGLSYLMDKIAITKSDTLKKHDFANHLFALSGASGGTVGEALFANLMMMRDSQPSYTSRTDKIFEGQDFLTPAIGTYFTRDLLTNILSLIPNFIHTYSTTHDRSEVLHQTFEHRIEEAIQRGDLWVNNFTDPNNTQNVPLFFSNTTHVQSGKRAIIGPVRIEENIFDHSLDLLAHIPEEKDLSWGVAALMSARFPYISSSAQIKEGLQFVDGGYFDNFGATTTLDVARFLHEMKLSHNLNFDINLIVFQNSEDIIDTSCIAELNVPPSALYNIRSGHTFTVLKRLKRFINEKDGKVFHLKLNSKLNDPPKNAPKQYVYPLGWFLSNRAVQGIKLNLIKKHSPENATQLEDIISHIKSY